MAEERKYYPMLPIGSWWELRKKFKQSIPGVVTANYLATVLGGKVDSARINVLPYLKQLGIIDEEGKTLERAKIWRDDGHYSEVCKTILGEVYPAELLSAVPDPDANREQAERWFANDTGTGAVAARRMASLYALLVEGDPAKAPDKEKKERPTKERGARAAKAVPIAHATFEPSSPPRDPHSRTDHQEDTPPLPGVHINLQVHISADATSDQIDQVFASMAKHIYQRA